MRIRGVIFDLFHTLTARESEWSDLPWTSDVLGIERAAWNQALTQNSRWRLSGEVRDPIEIVRSLAHRIDPTIPEEVILKAASFRQQRFRQSLGRIPVQNIHLLEELRARGFLLGLISNADASEIIAWPGCVLAGLFDSEVFSCAVGSVKPEPAIYAKCLSNLGVSAPECIFVGDGGSKELEGARAVGLYSVLFSGVVEELWPERVASLAENSDAHIRELRELLSLPVLCGKKPNPALKQTAAIKPASAA